MQHRTETAVGLFVMAAFGILLFFSYQLGVFHLNSDDYVLYKVQFADVNGLLKKADVKMAGVKIGWVDDLQLVENSQVLVSIKIKKECCIYENASVSIKQDGMLGGKFIDLFPGNSAYALVSSGNYLKAASPQAGIDDVMRDFRSLSHQVELLTSNVNVFLTQVSGQNSVVSDAQTVLKETAQLISLLQEMMQHNKGGLYSSVESGNAVLSDLQKYLPELAERLKQTTDTVDLIATDAHAVIKKVNNADGSIGKLLNDDSLHQNIYHITHDVESAVSFFKNIDFVLDARVEGAAPHHGFFNGTKAFFDLRIHPCRNYFGIIGLVVSQCGFMQKCDHLECEAHELHQRTIMLIKRNKPLLNLQIARILGDCVCAVRAGVFQNTPGIGFDVQIPLINPFRWVSTIELYDLMGTQRICGNDPYLKWYNRLFFGEHVYAEIGIDDIINSQGRHAIFGAGIRFADDELLKCFLN